MVEAANCGLALDEGQPRTASLLAHDDGLAVAEIGSVCVAVWRGAVTRGRFEVQRRGLGWVVGRHPEGVGFLCVIERVSPLPDQDLRRASANMIAIHRPYLRYVACVMEGDSIRAAVVRAVLTGMRLLVTGKFTTGFFSAVPEAAHHLGEHLPIGPESSFASAVEAVRASLDSP